MLSIDLNSLFGSAPLALIEGSMSPFHSIEPSPAGDRRGRMVVPFRPVKISGS